MYAKNSLPAVDESHFQKVFLKKTHFIDVRAPVEFQAGSIPNAVNLPLLTDEERHQVGICYKQYGQPAAIELGHKLVGGTVKEQRVQSWYQFIKQNPNAIIYCFRGGLRSQTTQLWLAECGLNVPLIAGGYKALRRFLMNSLDSCIQDSSLILIGGKTGSGKTFLIQEFQAIDPKTIDPQATQLQAIDLEGLANHRGSAFGYEATPQPTQIDFENRLSVAFFQKSTLQESSLQKPSVTYLLEDESRLIGRLQVPENLFKKMRESPLLLVEEPLEVRANHILNTYIVQKVSHLLNPHEQAQHLRALFVPPLQNISKKLGLERTKICLNELEIANQKLAQGEGFSSQLSWITQLLQWYYDPMYLYSLEKRNPEILFRGSGEEIKDWLREKTTSPCEVY